MLPGGSDKVESASRSCGVKDATVASIISHITANGKSLRSSKSLKNTNTTQKDTNKAGAHDFINVDIAVLVRSFVLKSFHTHTATGSNCNSRK